MDKKTEIKGKFIPGQRWISDSEPELGLGIILEIGFREVKISFRASNVVRVYMHRNAPLRRVRLKAGDRARSNDGRMFVVKTIKEFGGLLIYYGEGLTLKEQDLLDRMTFSDPDKRLLAGQVGKAREFALRFRTHQFRREMLGSRVRGLVGARMELLDHQISIAHEVASRHHPKVLLADEVGLGKTIEAGMIFHRLYRHRPDHPRAGGRAFAIGAPMAGGAVPPFQPYVHGGGRGPVPLRREGRSDRQSLPQPPDHDLRRGFPVRVPRGA